MAHALQIYSIVDKRLVLHTNLINPILDKVGNRPVAVYSICGPLRKGKSFMLSMWLRYLVTKGEGDWVNHNLENKFNYRAGAERETTGIYMWSEPFIFKGEDGKETALLLLDSQGSFDQETTMQENAIVFALCTLLSSYITFNLTGQTSEDLIQFIQYFASYARLADGYDQDEPFQKLCFLIRDFQHVCDYEYGYYDNQNSINGKNYKQFALDRKSQQQEVNFVHEMILATFSDVGFYLMPHPGKELATRGIFNSASVDTEFLSHLKSFTELMLKPEGLLVKRIGGQIVTGTTLKALVNRWAEVFRSETLSESKTVFQATAEVQHEMARQAALENYNRRIKGFLNNNDMQGFEPSVFEDMHRQILEESVSLFHSFKKIGGKEMTVKYLEAIKSELGQLFENYRDVNANYVRMQTLQREFEEAAKVNAERAQAIQAEIERVRADLAAKEREIADLRTQSGRRRGFWGSVLDVFEDIVTVIVPGGKIIRDAIKKF